MSNELRMKNFPLARLIRYRNNTNMVHSISEIFRYLFISDGRTSNHYIFQVR